MKHKPEYTRYEQLLKYFMILWKKQKENSIVLTKILYFAKSENTVREDKLLESENLLQPLNPQQSELWNQCKVSMHFCGM